MKKIILKKLTLENWRAQNISLTFSDGITEIRAKNGVGKSTLFNAWLWLLLGVDSLDRANYDLYDTKQELSKDTPAAIVEAELEVDGVAYKLRRSAKSQWTRSRGSQEWTKASSDKYTFMIDDVEYQAKQYNEMISGLFAGQDADTIKMMANPAQATNLEWKQLRKMFQKIIGEIKPEDYKGDYSLIADGIATHGFDIAKQAVMNHVAAYKKDLKEVEDELKAKERTLPDLSKCDEAATQIEDKKVRIAEIDAQITGVGDANKPYIEKRKAEDEAIAKKKSELSRRRSEHRIAAEEKLSGLQAAYNKALSERKEIEDYNAAIPSKIAALKKDISSVRDDITFLEEQVQELRAQRDACSQREFKYNDVCPTCGQQLPYDEAKISAARQKFYDVRDAEKAAIVEKGKASRHRLDERKARLAELESQQGGFRENPLPDVTPYMEALKKAKASIEPFESTQEYADLMNELSDMEENRTQIPAAPDTTALEEEKQQLLSEVQTLSEITAYRRIHAKISEEIEAKQKVQKATATTLALEEQKLDKFVEYEREHASIISCRVNQYLRIANVKMLSVNKSGEYTDCCVITCDTVGNTMNRASVIRTGVDVANAFQRYFGIEAPLYIDDCDAIAPELIPLTEGQQIRLVFDKTYEKITIV